MKNLQAFKRWCARWRTTRVLYLLVARYFRDGVGKTAAMLAYNLLFSFFPLLLFLSMVLGWLNISYDAVTQRLDGILPDAVVQIAAGFTEHLAEVPVGTGLATFSIVFTLYFPVRAVTVLIGALQSAGGMRMTQVWWKRWLTGALFTVLLALALFAALGTVVFSSRALLWISDNLVPISDTFITLWDSLRFIVLGALLWLTVTVLYRLSTPRHVALRRLMPGAFAATGGWVLLSVAFSYYVANMGNYSAVYGSIGAIIILMVWLFLSAVVIIMGDELNCVLIESRTNLRLE